MRDYNALVGTSGDLGVELAALRQDLGVAERTASDLRVRIAAVEAAIAARAAATTE
jgi:hypothetical protein